MGNLQETNLVVNKAMKNFKPLLIIFFALFIINNTIAQSVNSDSTSAISVYKIKKLKKSIQIDGDWDKRAWHSCKAIEIKNPLINKAQFTPAVQAKMMYDNENIYVIFRVKDRYVRSVTKEINGPVWKDSAVEFFFSPNTSLPESYFNLEVNSGGTPLLGYNTKPRVKPQIDDIKLIEIAHSLPQVVDPEITEPVTWTVEYRIPLSMLEKYSNVTRPKKGVTWRANFYKIAEITSNPHYLTWSPIDQGKTSFHLPQFFGLLKFQ